MHLSIIGEAAMKTATYGYTRVSGKGQVGGHGLTRQRDAIHAYAKANGLKVVKLFQDAGVSGTLERRPGLAAMMLAIAADGVRVVLVERLGRLARDLLVQEAIVRDLQRRGVELVSTTEGADLGSAEPTRKLVRHVFGALAEYQKSMTVLKLRAARAAKRATGAKVEGRKAYGEVDGGEYATVKRIRELRRKRRGRKRLGLRRIAKQLQAEGHKTRGGGKWQPSSVQSILAGAVYASTARARPTVTAAAGKVP